MLVSQSSRRTFTLVELVVVVVVLGVLAAVGVFSYQLVLTRSHDSADSASVSTMLRATAAVAASREADVPSAADFAVVLPETSSSGGVWSAGSDGVADAYRETVVVESPEFLTVGAFGKSGKCVLGRIDSSSGVSTWTADASQCTEVLLPSAVNPSAPTTTTSTTLPRPREVLWYVGQYRVAPNGSPVDFADGVSSAAKFTEPWGLTSDAAGVVYVADHFNHRVRAVAADGSVSTVAGDGVAGWRTTGGAYDRYATVPVAQARFNRPRAVAVAADGVMYVADRQNNTVRRIDLAGNVTTVIGTGAAGSCCGAPPVNANPLLLALRNPTGVALDPTGEWLWVSSTNNGAIYRLNLVSNVLSLVTQVTPAGTEQPTQIEFDAAGNAFVSSAYGVHRIDAVTLAVSSIVNPSRSSTPAVNCASGPFCFAYGLAVSPDGSTVWVANRDFNQILEIDVDPSNFAASPVSVLAGASRVAGYTNGAFGVAQFYYPLDVMYVASGNYLLVSDSANQVLRRINL